MTFMECLNTRLVDCGECKGTGHRGAKKNGRKKCGKCSGTGKLVTCEPNEGCRGCSYFPAEERKP